MHWHAGGHGSLASGGAGEAIQHAGLGRARGYGVDADTKLTWVGDQPTAGWSAAGDRVGAWIQQGESVTYTTDVPRPAMRCVAAEMRELRIDTRREQSCGVALRDSGTGLDIASAERLFDAICATKPDAWVWGCQYAARLSRLTRGDCGRRRTYLEELPSSSRCPPLQTIRHNIALQIGNRSG